MWSYWKWRFWFYAASLQQRADWFSWLIHNIDQNIRSGTSDWFTNISTILAGFIATGQDDNGWILAVDANILVAVQDGYTTALGYNAGVSAEGAKEWNSFFTAVQKRNASANKLIELWGWLNRQLPMPVWTEQQSWVMAERILYLGCGQLRAGMIRGLQLLETPIAARVATCVPMFHAVPFWEVFLTRAKLGHLVSLPLAMLNV